MVAESSLYTTAQYKVRSMILDNYFASSIWKLISNTQSAKDADFFESGVSVSQLLRHFNQNRLAILQIASGQGDKEANKLETVIRHSGSRAYRVIIPPYVHSSILHIAVVGAYQKSLQ